MSRWLSNRTATGELNALPRFNGWSRLKSTLFGSRRSLQWLLTAQGMTTSDSSPGNSTVTKEPDPNTPPGGLGTDWPTILNAAAAQISGPKIDLQIILDPSVAPVLVLDSRGARISRQRWQELADSTFDAVFDLMPHDREAHGTDERTFVTQIDPMPDALRFASAIPIHLHQALTVLRHQYPRWRIRAEPAIQLARIAYAREARRARHDSFSRTRWVTVATDVTMQAMAHLPDGLFIGPPVPRGDQSIGQLLREAQALAVAKWATPVAPPVLDGATPQSWLFDLSLGHASPLTLPADIRTIRPFLAKDTETQTPRALPSEMIRESVLSTQNL